MKCRIIPVPKKVISGGEIVKTAPYIDCRKEEWLPMAEAFCECMKKIYNINFTYGAGGVEIICDDSIEPEAYRLETGDAIRITASGRQGCAYGLATAVQLLNEKLETEKIYIEDKPDKDYRGLMVDLARKWHPFATLLHYVDLCFFYKIKYLHLHFMDDQSYTLPSRAFPKLPTKNRAYSFSEIEKLKLYAQARGVVIVPEIEMPGHARSLNEAYPELFSDMLDENAAADLITENGAVIDHKSIICAGSSVTFENIKKLIDETIELFPDTPYIHLGGDEANIKVWQGCENCRRYMQEHNIADVYELYCDFTAKVTDYVLEKGKTPIIWEGFPKKYADRISKDVIVIGWENYYQRADELIEAGYRVINCSWQPLYVVPNAMARWNVSDIMKWNVYEWQHWWEKSAAMLNPIHIAPTEQVIGAQLCAWEQTYEREIAFTAENIAALSERTWSVKRECNDSEFHDKLYVQSEKVFALIAE